MKKMCLLFVAATTFWASAAMAGTMGPLTAQSDKSWVTTITAGPVWISGGKAYPLFLTPQIVNIYSNKKSNEALASGELFFGIQKTLPKNVRGQLGLVFGTLESFDLNGKVWENADPRFDNYTYHYKIRHNRVGVKGKLLVNKGHWPAVWISGAAGLSANRARNFTSTEDIHESLPTRSFISNTKTSFTYSVGAGVQQAINKNWKLGMGYEFSDLGKSQLNRAPEQIFGTGLTLRHLYTNGLLINLTYVS